jgi:sulfate transport system ATP-binding protein
MEIGVENVSKQFGSFKALDQINLEIEPGSLVSLLGPSGSGKSTLLRTIAGLETPDTGKIWISGRDATHAGVQDRNIGFVFQHYALFKHLTIRENIAFGLKLRKAPPNRIKARVDELLELVQLSGLGNRYPSQLSGGQRQRVALARSLAVEPQVMLLDEPFGALDAKVRKDLRTWLRRLHEEVGITTILVTHDQEEAMEVSSEIVVMNQGRIEQIGKPAEIYDHPATAFVMSFIGPVNVLPSSSRLFQDTRFNAAHPQVFLRPHDVVVDIDPDGTGTSAQVSRIVHLGWEIDVLLELDDAHEVKAILSREQFDKLKLEAGQRVFIKPKSAKSFPSATEQVAAFV